MYQTAEIFLLNIANTPREKKIFIYVVFSNVFMIFYSDTSSSKFHTIMRGQYIRNNLVQGFSLSSSFCSIFLVCWLVAALCWGCRSSRLVEASSKGIANDPRGAAVLPRNFFLLRTPWIKVLCSDYDWYHVCINDTYMQREGVKNPRTLSKQIRGGGEVGVLNFLILF